MTALARLLAREPVALGAAVVAWVAVFGPSEAVMAATVATIGVAQRWLSTPTVKVDEQVSAAVTANTAEVAAYLNGAADK